MTPRHKAILEAIPYDNWVTDHDIAGMAKICTVRNLRSYILPTLCRFEYVERRQGVNGHLPSRYRRKSDRVHINTSPLKPVTITIDRKCLTCSRRFQSEGRHNHICHRCSETNRRWGE